MNTIKSAFFAAVMLAAVPAQAQTALVVEPEQVHDLAQCQASALAQVKTYRAVAAMMRGSRQVAVDETTKHFLDRTADSFSTFSDTLLTSATRMDDLAQQIFIGSSSYASYKLVVDHAARTLLNGVARSAFGPLPSSGPTEDLGVRNDRCSDLVTAITQAVGPSHD